MKKETLVLFCLAAVIATGVLCGYSLGRLFLPVEQAANDVDQYVKTRVYDLRLLQCAYCGGFVGSVMAGIGAYRIRRNPFPREREANQI